MISGLTVQPAVSPLATKAKVDEGFDTTVALDDLSLEGVNRHFMDQRWGDGLPVVPPTRERVKAMLRYSDRSWEKMRDSGLRMVFLGAESGSDETLARMNKGGSASTETARDRSWSPSTTRWTSTARSCSAPVRAPSSTPSIAG